jgi:hypothetical protein
MSNQDKFLIENDIPMQTNPRFVCAANQIQDIESRIETERFKPHTNWSEVKKLQTELRNKQTEIKAMNRFLPSLSPSSSASIEAGHYFGGAEGFSDHEGMSWSCGLAIAAGLNQSQVEAYLDSVRYPLKDQAIQRAFGLQKEGRSLGYLDLSQSVLAAYGWDRHRMAELSVMEQFQRAYELSASYSTSSVSSVVRNVANMSLFAGWSASQANLVGLRMCRIIPATNFKSFFDVSLVCDELLEKVGSSGQVKTASMSADAYAVKVEDFSKILHISREDVVNDDLQSLTNAGRLLGGMAARTIEKHLIKQLANATTNVGAGSTEFFIGLPAQNRQANYISGANPLNKTTLIAAVQQLRKQTSPRDKQPLSFNPSFLLCGDADSTVARELCSSNSSLYPGVDVLESSWLHSSHCNPSATPSDWYLGHRSDAGAAIVCAFLGGISQPVIELGNSSFKTLGVELRATLSFGSVLADPRCIVKNEKTS